MLVCPFLFTREGWLYNSYKQFCAGKYEKNYEHFCIREPGSTERLFDLLFGIHEKTAAPCGAAVVKGLLRKLKSPS
jgi:hypothetical protein